MIDISDLKTLTNYVSWQKWIFFVTPRGKSLNEGTKKLKSVISEERERESGAKIEDQSINS